MIQVTAPCLSCTADSASGCDGCPPEGTSGVQGCGRHNDAANGQQWHPYLNDSDGLEHVPPSHREPFNDFNPAVLIAFLHGGDND